MTTTQNDLSIAKTIYNQIGGPAFYMLGALNFTGSSDSLNFKIRGSQKCNYIKITLNALDLYNIKYYKIRGTTCKLVSEETDLYFDMLHKSIERNTGLYTSL